MKPCPFCQSPIYGVQPECPSCHADLSQVPDFAPSVPPPSPVQTVKENIANVRPDAEDAKATLKESPEAFKKPSRTRRKPKPATQTKREKASTQGGDDSALPFRPVNRPPTLILCALDDGSRDEGEWFRIRSSPFRIGRTEGNFIVPHDNGVSGRHLEIALKYEDGSYRFFLRDTGSRNGTFVRVAKALLKNGQELLIGARRYYFRSGEPTPNDPSSDAEFAAGWQADTPANAGDGTPRIVEMTPRGDGQTFPLEDGENLFGTDAATCSIVVAGDPFLSGVHARIFKDQKNRWMIENRGSLNGIWLRIMEMPLDTGGEFQIGEQRFLVRIP